MRKRHAAIGLAALCVGAACDAGAPPADSGSQAAAVAETDHWTLTPDLEVRLLHDGVWLHTSWEVLGDGQRIPSNGLLVESRGELLLVDSAWGENRTRELVAWVRRTLGLPIREAVFTHFHDDRISGAAALIEEEIPFHTHARTPDLAGPDLPAPPLKTVDQEPLTVMGAEVYFPGAAHTVDNLFVWIEELGILFGGCAVRPGSATGLGNTEDADVSAWPGTVRRVRDRHGAAARVVIPSHGPPGGPDLLDHTLALLETAREEP